jgi:hypothetical protein
MAGLWAIEVDIRGQDPETRVKTRQEKSAAIVAALFDLWHKELPRLSGKSYGDVCTARQGPKVQKFTEQGPQGVINRGHP